MDLVRTLLADLGLDGLDPARASVTGAGPVLPSRYPLGEGAAAVLAVLGLVLGRLGELRGLPAQAVRVDVRHAGALLRGFLDQRVDGTVRDPDPTGRLPLVGLFRGRDNGVIQTYGAFSPLRERTLAVLGMEDPGGGADATDAAVADARRRVARAVAAWDAEPLAEALVANGAPAATVRSAADWAAHPQGALLRATPVVDVRRIGEAPRRDAVSPASVLSQAARPLEGVRVLDLSRIVAGPVCGRTLAEHGADVLSVASPGLHAVGRALVDTGPGKRAAELDLADADDRLRLERLVAGADVFCSSARPGSFARRGLGPAELAQLRPGIVVVAVDAFGSDGPWAARPGFEPLAQASAGWAVDHAAPDGTPRVVEALPCDHLSGFLAALGTTIALLRRAREGGSWEVRVSLTRTAMWLRDLGAPHDPATAPALGVRDTLDLRERLPGPFGAVDQLRPQPWLSATPPFWDRPAAPPGTDPPAWR